MPAKRRARPRAPRPISTSVRSPWPHDAGVHDARGQALLGQQRRMPAAPDDGQVGTDRARRAGHRERVEDRRAGQHADAEADRVAAPARRRAPRRLLERGRPRSRPAARETSTRGGRAPAGGCGPRRAGCRGRSAPRAASRQKPRARSRARRLLRADTALAGRVRARTSAERGLVGRRTRAARTGRTGASPPARGRSTAAGAVRLDHRGPPRRVAGRPLVARERPPLAARWRPRRWSLAASSSTKPSSSLRRPPGGRPRPRTRRPARATAPSGRAPRGVAAEGARSDASSGRNEHVVEAEPRGAVATTSRTRRGCRRAACTAPRCAAAARAAAQRAERRAASRSNGGHAAQPVVARGRGAVEADVDLVRRAARRRPHTARAACRWSPASAGRRRAEALGDRPEVGARAAARRPSAAPPRRPQAIASSTTRGARSRLRLGAPALAPDLAVHAALVAAVGDRHHEQAQAASRSRRPCDRSAPAGGARSPPRPFEHDVVAQARAATASRGRGLRAAASRPNACGCALAQAARVGSGDQHAERQARAASRNAGPSSRRAGAGAGNEPRRRPADARPPSLRGRPPRPAARARAAPAAASGPSG